MDLPSFDAVPQHLEIRTGVSRFLRIQNSQGMGPVEGLLAFLHTQKKMFDFAKSAVYARYRKFLIANKTDERCVVGCTGRTEAYNQFVKKYFQFGVLPDQLMTHIHTGFCQELNKAILTLCPNCDPNIPTFDIYEGETTAPCIVSKLEIMYMKDYATYCKTDTFGNPVGLNNKILRKTSKKPASHSRKILKLAA